MEHYFKETCPRLLNERYQLRLPFKSFMNDIPDNVSNSMAGAINRLHQVVRRLPRDPTRHNECVKFMDTGYISIIGSHKKNYE